MIGYNPCGALVDWGRHRYRTKCRFFEDSDFEADIEWYPCTPEAQAIPFPVAIYQTIWDREGDDEAWREGVGEVYGAKHVTTHKNAIPGAIGDHQCGTRSDFENGAIYDPDLVVQYRPDGLPVCCPDRGPKGIMWGSPHTPPVRGGIKWGGHAVMDLTYTVPSCAEPGAAHLIPNDATTAVLLAPAYAGSTSAFLYIADHGTDPVRVSYSGTQTGSVFVFSLVYPSFCILGTVLYSGPADVPFEMDFTPSPTRDICLAVGTSPDPYTACLVRVGPVPP